MSDSVLGVEDAEAITTTTTTSESRTQMKDGKRRRLTVIDRAREGAPGNPLAAGKPKCAGCPETLSEEDLLRLYPQVESVIVMATSKPDILPRSYRFSWRKLRIVSGTVQVVAGLRYRLELELCSGVPGDTSLSAEEESTQISSSTGLSYSSSSSSSAVSSSGSASQGSPGSSSSSSSSSVSGGSSLTSKPRCDAFNLDYVDRAWEKNPEKKIDLISMTRLDRPVSSDSATMSSLKLPLFSSAMAEEESSSTGLAVGLTFLFLGLFAAAGVAVFYRKRQRQPLSYMSTLNPLR